MQRMQHGHRDKAIDPQRSICARWWHRRGGSNAVKHGGWPSFALVSAAGHTISASYIRQYLLHSFAGQSSLVLGCSSAMGGVCGIRLSGHLQLSSIRGHPREESLNYGHCKLRVFAAKVAMTHRHPSLGCLLIDHFSVEATYSRSAPRNEVIQYHSTKRFLLGQLPIPLSSSSSHSLHSLGS